MVEHTVSFVATLPAVVVVVEVLADEVVVVVVVVVVVCVVLLTPEVSSTSAIAEISMEESGSNVIDSAVNEPDLSSSPSGNTT